MVRRVERSKVCQGSALQNLWEEASVTHSFEIVSFPDHCSCLWSGNETASATWRGVSRRSDYTRPLTLPEHGFPFGWKAANTKRKHAPRLSDRDAPERTRRLRLRIRRAPERVGNRLSNMSAGPSRPLPSVLLR